MENKESLFHLRDLSAMQMDSISGFQYIEEKCKDNSHKNLFKKFGKESLGMWEELNAEIINRGGIISTQGSLKGAINHLWMKMKNNFNGDISTILESIVDCETINLHRYKHALEAKDIHLNKLLSQHILLMETRLEIIKAIKQD
jgi:uncharacterized protein (TIGR02284 family)